MPPINNDRAETGRLPGGTWLPARDNPFAWKHLVAQGKLGARELLTTLSDDELHRYMAVARDQIGIEERRRGLKIASAISGVAIVAAAIGWGASQGFTKATFAGLGLGLVFCYWPWRVLKCRALWLKHFEAAKAEDERRRAPG